MNSLLTGSKLTVAVRKFTNVLPEDTVVVAALQADDDKMFERLFRHYYASLCRYVNGIVNDPDESEDIVQQTMIAFWEKRKDIQVSVSLKSYLYRSVHNAAMNRIRQQKVRTLYAESRSHDMEPAADTTTYHMTGNELQQQLQSAIGQLPEQCRLVFKLSRFNDMKYSEIAGHLGISVKTVENHMGKALRLLRMQLKDYMIWLGVLLSNYFS